jgi:hypothetical protein
MNVMRCSPVVAALLLGTVFLALSAPAFAHTASLHEVLTAAPPEAALPWTAFALLATVAHAEVSRELRLGAGPARRNH